MHASTSKATGAIRRNLRRAAFVLGGALLVAYLLAGIFFSFHFLPGTSINGRDASLSTSAQIADQIVAAETGRTTIQGAGINLVIDGDDLGHEFDPSEFSDAANKHYPGLTWPVALFGNRDFTISEGTYFDEGELEAELDEAVQSFNDTAVFPANASIVYSDEEDSYVVQAEQEGTALDGEKVLQAVERGIYANDVLVRIDESERLEPTLHAGDPRIFEAIARANQIANIAITLTIYDNDYYTVGLDELRSWIGLDESCQVTGNQTAINTWVENVLAPQINTVGTTRTYLRPDGKTCTVTGGTYGWDIDEASLEQSIADSVRQCKSARIPIPLSKGAYALSPGGQDWGPRYIDVDLSEQLVRFYDGVTGLAWYAPCVSGNVSAGTLTKTGVFVIGEMKSPTTLIGADLDGDGEPDYTNDVNYWMEFYNLTYGLHDAPWRSYFGGTIYQYNGSHGCVNLPPQAASILYSLVSIGDVVVVHN